MTKSIKKTISFLSSLGLLVSTQFSSPVFADYGSPPKQEFFILDKDDPRGPKLFNEAESSLVNKKRLRIQSSWDSFSIRLEKYINKGIKQESKTIIANAMSSLKLDMRSVSKAVCQGDIIVRFQSSDVDAIPNFDYNSGKFVLKNIAQKAEDIFDKVNELYFYGIDAGAEKALKDLAEAQQLFREWTLLVDNAL